MNGGGETDYSVPGFRIRSAPQGEWPLLVQANARQPDWRLHDFEGLSKGGEARETTIRYRDADFRIGREEETAAGWVYYLIPWPEGEIRLHVVVLAADAMADEAERNRQSESIIRRSHNSAQYEILFGWLPSAIQERLSDRYQFSPAEATRKNGMLEMMLGIALGAPMMLSGIPPAAILAWFMALEGAMRWLHGKIGEGACGVFVLEIPARIFGRIAAARRKGGDRGE